MAPPLFTPDPSNPHGFGARHRHDHAPFTLWNPTAQRYSGPDSDASKWIASTFGATYIRRTIAHLVIFTDTPPSPVPLTVGCLTAIFVPSAGTCPPRIFSPSKTGCCRNEPEHSSPRIPELGPVCGFIGFPHLPDPLADKLNFKGGSTKPTKADLVRIVDALRPFVDVLAVTAYGPALYVEVRGKWVGGPAFAKTLPGRVAGLGTTYCFDKEGEEGLWGDFPRANDERPDEMATKAKREDSHSEKVALHPGARVVDSMAGEGVASTAGVLLRRDDARGGGGGGGGEESRMTVSNSAFSLSDEVFLHDSADPTAARKRIGVIDARMPAEDVALVRLDPGVRFGNTYVVGADDGEDEGEEEEEEAEDVVMVAVGRPRRLERAAESRYGAWYTVPGAAAGDGARVAVQIVGKYLRVVPPSAPTLGGQLVAGSEYEEYSVLHCPRGIPGAAGEEGGKGVSGAPLVSCDKAMGGAVSGFVRHVLNEKFLALSSVVDGVVERGWGLA